MSLINTSTLATISNANVSLGYDYVGLHNSLNASGYGLTQSFDGSLILNPKTPAYVFDEQLRLLVDKAIDISAPVFSKLGDAASSIDRAFTRALTIFPGAAAEKVTEACTPLKSDQCKEQAHPTQGFNIEAASNQKQFDSLCDHLRENSNISGVVVLPEGKGLTCFFKMSHHDIQNLLKKAQGEKVVSTVLNIGTTSIKAGIYSTGSDVGFIVLPNENSLKKLLHYSFNYQVIGDRNTKQSQHGEGSTIYTQGSPYFHTANTYEEIRDCGGNAYIECMYKVSE